MDRNGIGQVGRLLFVVCGLVVLVAQHVGCNRESPAPEQTVTTSDAAPLTLAGNRIVVYCFHGRERCELAPLFPARIPGIPKSITDGQ